MEKLLLIDGNSMLFRAYYATLYSQKMSTSNGIPTNAIFGFINMLNKAIALIAPDYVFVAWDAGKKTFRHQAYEAYKGTRKPLDQDLIVQFPIAREYLDAAMISRYETEGYEADDIIGSYAKQSSNVKVTILTSDRDLLQLVDDHTSVLLMKKGITDMELVDPATFEEKYGLEPLQLIDLKGLMGDTSDNIPGVKGVGEKTAIKLLQSYQSVENVYAHIDEIKGKLQEKLITSKEDAFMSKQLATIYTQVELPYPLDELNYDPDVSALNEFFKKYEMRSMIVNNAKEKEKVKVETVSSWPLIEGACLLMPVCSKEAFLNQRVYGFMAYHEDHLYFIEAKDACEDTAFSRFLLENKKISTWDAKEGNHCLSKLGLPTCLFLHDFHLASFLLHSQATNEDALLEALQIELCESLHEAGKKTKEEEAYSKTRMLAITADWIKALANKQEMILSELKKQDVYELYEMIEKPLSPILFGMEQEGISVDINVLDTIDQVVSKQMEDLSEKIYEQAHMIFNINSPKQLANVLYDELGLKAPGKKRSTSADVLEKLRNVHPIINDLLEYRKVAKIKSTYIEGLKKHIQPDGKIHTTLNQTMTQTGRLSSSDPNLQNISVRDQQGKEIRKAFVAKDGYVLLSADYSQIELRMLAHMANETNMIEAFKEDKDIHTNTATLIYGCTSDEVDDQMRRVAKTVNFGIVYGQTAFGLSDELKISRKEADHFMETYFASYPNIHSYMNSLIEFCKEHGYVKTLFDRRRYIPEINDKNFMTREFGKRAAMNAPIQGSAADLIKVAMIKMAQAMKEADVSSKMVLQIHDELIFLVPNEELEMMQKLVKETMESAMDLLVPLKVSMSYGQSWYEAK